MREILFRGKRVDNGEWVYGYPLIDTAPCSLKAEGKCACPHDGSTADMFYWNDDFHEYDSVGVVADTIGQYTGLVDHNKAKIFEGDICRVTHFWPNGKTESWNFVIEFGNPNCLNSWGWQLWPINTDEFKYNTDILLWVENDYGTTCEVIGNIYDNPELLEQEA